MNLYPIDHTDKINYNFDNSNIFDLNNVKLSTIIILLIFVFIFIGLFFRKYGLTITNGLRSLHPYLKMEPNELDIPFKIKPNRLTQKISV